MLATKVRGPIWQFSAMRGSRRTGRQPCLTYIRGRTPQGDLMIVQAIVALLQQAPEIDRATGRSCFLYRATADNFLLGFRRLHIPRGGAVGGTKFVTQPFGRLIGGLLFAASAAREAGKKYLKGGPAARRGLYVLLPAASSSTQPSASSPASSAQPSPSCPASVWLPSELPPSACGSSTCSSTIGAAAIIRCSSQRRKLFAPYCTPHRQCVPSSRSDAFEIIVGLAFY